MTRIFKTWVKVVLIGFACFSTLELFAQSRQVTGTVTSSEGNQPVAGVTVTVKGTKNSVATDASGQYRITVDNNASALVFWSITHLSKSACDLASTTMGINPWLMPHNSAH